MGKGVIVVTKGRIYQYPNKIKELLILNSELRNEFSDIAKQLKINKSKFVQEMYRQVILNYQTGTLTEADRNITITIKRSSICKG
jgi:hypothetical protein